MTRYNGTLLKAEKVSNRYETKLQPQDTIRYKTYKYVKSSKKPLTLNEIHKAVSPDSVRRVFERILCDLANAGYINRYKCQCGCSYIYKP